MSVSMYQPPGAGHALWRLHDWSVRARSWDLGEVARRVYRCFFWGWWFIFGYTTLIPTNTDVEWYTLFLFVCLCVCLLLWLYIHFDVAHKMNWNNIYFDAFMISMSCIKELFAQKHLATVREICLCGSVPHPNRKPKSPETRTIGWTTWCIVNN